MSTRRGQRGITLTGLIMAAALVIGVSVTGMKLWPLFNEMFKVRAAMTSVAGQSNIAGMSTTDIYKLVLKNFEVSDVETFDTPDNLRAALKVQKIKDKPARMMQFKYEKRGPLFGPLDVVLKIDEQMEIPGVGVTGN